MERTLYLYFPLRRKNEEIFLLLVLSFLVVGIASTSIVNQAEAQTRISLNGGTCYDNPSNANCNGAYATDADAQGHWCYADGVVVVYNGITYQTTWTYPGTGTLMTTRLMYSAHCRTNWSETLSHDSNGYRVNGQIYRASGPDGGSLFYQSGLYLTGDAFSPMVYAPNNQARACATDSNNVQHCTGWV